MEARNRFTHKLVAPGRKLSGTQPVCLQKLIESWVAASLIALVGHVSLQGGVPAWWLLVTKCLFVYVIVKVGNDVEGSPAGSSA